MLSPPPIDHGRLRRGGVEFADIMLEAMRELCEGCEEGKSERIRGKHRATMAVRGFTRVLLKVGCGRKFRQVKEELDYDLPKVECRVLRVAREKEGQPTCMKAVKEDPLHEA